MIEFEMRMKGLTESQRSHTMSIPWQQRAPSVWTRNQKALARPTCGQKKSSAVAEEDLAYRDIRKRVRCAFANRAWRCLQTTRKSTVAAAATSIRASKHLRFQVARATACHQWPPRRGFHSLRYNHTIRASGASIQFYACVAPVDWKHLVPVRSAAPDGCRHGENADDTVLATTLIEVRGAFKDDSASSDQKAKTRHAGQSRRWQLTKTSIIVWDVPDVF